jgi:hypothetical protein
MRRTRYTFEVFTNTWGILQVGVNSDRVGESMMTRIDYMVWICIMHGTAGVGVVRRNHNLSV